MRFFLFFIFFIPACFFAQPDKSISTIISDIMKEQEKSWNSFDIDGFMKHYWKHDSLKFIGKNGITYGWQKTLNNYKKNYSDKEKMGTLYFANHLIEVLNDSCAIVCGNWKIKRKSEEIGGNYTLLWKKIKGQWVIVLDHTG